jgi:hypothetical protein
VPYESGVHALRERSAHDALIVDDRLESPAGPAPWGKYVVELPAYINGVT